MPVTTPDTASHMYDEWHQRVYNRFGAITYSFDSAPVTSTVHHFGSLTRNSNPSWKNQIEHGSNASTYYNRAEWSHIFSADCNYMIGSGLPGDSSWDRTTGRSIWDGGLTGTDAQGLTAIRHTTDMVVADQALSRLKSRLTAASGASKSMAPLAEISDLHRSIRGSIEATTTLFKSLLEIKRTKGRSAFTYASRAWLTWNFGIQPMIRDTQAALQAINDFKCRDDLSERMYGSAQTSGQYKFTMGAHINYMEFPVQATYVLSYRYVGAFDFALQSSNDYSVYDHLGLNARGIIPAVYELMPYSWALDYFMNIGNFLDDLFVIPSGSTKYLVQDRLYRAHFVITSKLATGTNPAIKLLKNSCRPGEAEYFQFERTPLASLPRIGLRFKTVDEIGSYGLTKMLNLSSILGKDAPELAHMRMPRG